MTKSFQDVIPPKRSIRNIEIPGRGKKVSDTVSVKTKPIKTKKIGEIKVTKKEPAPIDEVLSTKNDYTEYTYEPERKSGWFGWKSSIYVFGVLLLAFVVSSFFKSAEIRITPIEDTKSINDVFVAKKDTTSSSLGFQIVTTSKELERTIETSGEQQVNKKARGTIVVYNNYSDQSQRLVATTRFETQEGLIFRAVEGVTIPGKQTKDGKSVAGSVEVIVEADIPGDKYNIGMTDFSIVGFKGTPRYNQIYARSKTPMTGGFSGVEKVVPESTKTAIDKELETELKNQLLKDIKSQIPDNFVLYDNSINYSFEPITQKSVGGGATLKKKGLVNAIIFDKGDLSRAILLKALPNSVNDVVMVSNLEELGFSYDSGSSFDHNNSSTLNFKLAGEAKFVWVIDENKLKSDLLGLSQKNAKAILATYSMIKEAWINTSPFWNQTIPKDPDSVRLINTLTK